MTEPLTININGLDVTADLDTWRGVGKAILERVTADRQAQEAAQRARGEVWYAIYDRFHHRDEDECFSLGEAAGTLVGGEEAGALSAVGIRCPDGTVIDFDWDQFERLAQGE